MDQTVEIDETLEPLLAGWRERPEVIGVLLTGSRGFGCEDAESDYDLSVVMTEDTCDAEQEKYPHHPGHTYDVVYTSLERLAKEAENPGWMIACYIYSKTLMDKTGELTAILERMRRMDPEKARRETAGYLDAYLNSFYRAMKAAKRGNGLGNHLQAAESMHHLIRTLFFLHGLWPPYLDRLQHQWEKLLKAPHMAETLPQKIERILKTADPTAQQALEAEIEALLRAEGYGEVFDDWGDELPRVKSFQFGRY
jgi:hypothetical protein